MTTRSDGGAVREQAAGRHTSLQLRAELSALLDDYAGSLDDGDLDRWVGFFAEEAVYKVTGRDNFVEGLPHAVIYCDGLDMIRDRALAIQQTTVYEPRLLRHFVSGLRMHSADGEAIRSQANFLIIESLSDRDSSVFLAGQYHDRIVRRADRLLFEERICVFDSYRIATSLIMPV